MIRISIRLHILTIITLLVSVIVVSTIFANYYSTNKIINNSTQSIFQKAASDVETVIVDLFFPVKYRLDLGASLIKSNFVHPGPTPAFTSFLLQVFSHLTKSAIISFSTPNGDYYEILRNDDGTFKNLNIVCSSNSCTASDKIIDKNLKTIGPVKFTKWNKTNKMALAGTYRTPYDPRVRSWYRNALLAKQPQLSPAYWSGEGWYAVRYSVPIFQDSGKPLGILSLQIKTQILIDYIKNFNITEHAAAFVFNKDQRFIIGQSIKLPWVAASVQIYKENYKHIFAYKFNNTKYLAFYDLIKSLPSNDWYVAVILPMSDINAPLVKQVIISIAVAAIILLLGLFFIWLTATTLSKPITQLVAEAILIKKLEFPAIKKPTSRIKEIFYLQGAFNNMKESLRSFRRYVPYSLVRNLVAHGKVAKVGGEGKELTILFSDINGFTTLSEHMQPMDLMNYLSSYFDAMTKLITQKQGTVDKYMGDGIMVLWGAPSDDKLHALHACECAVLMQNTLPELNKNWKEKGCPELAIRIGIHTGAVVVGNLGSEDRLNYTVIGDNVNLASRLEGLNKLYNSKIVVSQQTYQLVKDHFDFRMLDYVSVKGKTTSVYVYELVMNQDKFENRLSEYNRDFAHAFALYKKGEWVEALAIFRNIAKEYPKDELASIYIERCSFFKNQPPTKWKGVWRLQ